MTSRHFKVKIIFKILRTGSAFNQAGCFRVVIELAFICIAFRVMFLEFFYWSDYADTFAFPISKFSFK